MSHNKQFQRLEKIAEPLKGEKERDTAKKAKMWQGSPFAWVYPLAPGSIGSVGRELVIGLCHDESLSAYQRKYRVHVGNKRLSVKCSVLGLSRQYFFENVKNHGYDFLFCLGISPDNVHAWVIPLDKLQEAEYQHGKADKWMTFYPNDPPELLRECGPKGELDEALKVLRSHLGI